MAKSKSVAVLDVSARLSEADQRLRTIVVDQVGEPSSADLAYFRALGWNVSSRYAPPSEQPQLIREIERMRQVVQWQAVAGTAEQRAELETEMLRALDEADEKLPGIQEQIRKLETEATKLRDRPKQLGKRLEQANTGVAKLRELAPADARFSYDSQMKDLERSLGHKIKSLRSRQQTITAVLQMDPSSQAAKIHCESLERSGREGMLIVQVEGNRRYSSVNVGEWSRYLSELRTELADIERQLPDLDDEYKARETDILLGTLDLYAQD